MKLLRRIVLCTLSGSEKSFIFSLFMIDKLIGDWESIAWYIILIEPITIRQVLDAARRRYQSSLFNALATIFLGPLIFSMVGPNSSIRSHHVMMHSVFKLNG